MKPADLNELRSSRYMKLKKRSQENNGTQDEKEKSAVVIPMHAMLKNELKIYRGKSKSSRLGVIRKYDELIAMSWKK